MFEDIYELIKYSKGINPDQIVSIIDFISTKNEREHLCCQNSRGNRLIESVDYDDETNFDSEN